MSAPGGTVPTADATAPHTESGAGSAPAENARNARSAGNTRNALSARKAEHTEHTGAVRRRLPVPGLLIPAVLAALLLLVALAGPWLMPHHPAAGTLDGRLAGPLTPGHLLGTDTQGRDILSRLVAGTRPSLIGGLVPVAVAGIAGTLLGAVAALAGRITEQALLRTLDILFAFPGVLLAITIATLLSPGLTTTVVALSIVLTPAVARVAFTEVQRIRTAEFLEAARVSGASRTAVVLWQIGPVVAPVVLVYCSSLVGLSIVYAAGLSFLGLGTPPPGAEWGTMLDELRPVLLTHPAVAVLPALAILAVSVVFNTLGNALQASGAEREAR
ncbi:ABC transporter permease [Streptomyces sp. CAU 1734]|uniref:ABC transporter permease n=1 Tax=Streptomyces sp. CAU 1734 TaxID=3140360 RepID=UPI0032600A9A